MIFSIFRKTVLKFSQNQIRIQWHNLAARNFLVVSKSAAGCHIMLLQTTYGIRSWTLVITSQFSTPTDIWINILNPSGFFTYRQVENSKILHGARFALSVLCGYQNRQRLLLCTALTDWLL